MYFLKNILYGVIVIGSDQVMTTLSSLPALWFVSETERVVTVEAVAQAIMSRASAFSGLSSMLHRRPQGMMGHALCIAAAFLSYLLLSKTTKIATLQIKHLSLQSVICDGNGKAHWEISVMNICIE